MIKSHLRTLAKRLGKSATLIAQETGLHRNSINALLHHRVDGIRFSTLDALCTTYGWQLHELLEYLPDQTHQPQMSICITAFEPLSSAWTLLSEYNRVDSSSDLPFGPLFLFAKEGICEVYVEARRMERLAESYSRYSITEWKLHAKNMQHARNEVSAKILHLLKTDLKAVSVREAYVFFQAFLEKSSDSWKLFATCDAFWLQAQERILTNELRKTRFSQNQLSLLFQTYNGLFEQWKRANQGLSKTGSQAELIQHVSEWGFAYPDEWFSEEGLILRNQDVRRTSADRHEKIEVNTSLQKNEPAYLYRQLFDLRTHADLLTRFGIRVFLRKLAQRVHIPYEDLCYALPEEIESLLKGLTTGTLLRERRRNGIAIQATQGSVQAFHGWDAIGRRNAQLLEKKEKAGYTIRIEANTRPFGSLLHVATKKHDGEGVLILPKFLSDAVLGPRIQGVIVEEALTKITYTDLVSRGLVIAHGVKGAYKRIQEGDIIDIQWNDPLIRVMKKPKKALKE